MGAYHRPYYSRPEKRPKEEFRVVVHPDGESVLKATKAATKGKTDRHLGRARSEDGRDGFDVFENGKIVERHIVDYKKASG